MRRLGARAGLLALMVAMSGAAWAKGESKGESKKTQKSVSELQKFNQEFQTAWNEGDFKKLEDLYAEDAIAVGPKGERVVGRDEIVQTEEKMKTQGPLRGTTSNFQLESVRQLSNDLYLATFKQEVAGLNKPGMPSEYSVISVLKKDGRDWKIVDQRVFPSGEQAIGGAGQECPPQSGTGGAGQEGVDQDTQIEQFELQQPSPDLPQTE